MGSQPRCSCDRVFGEQVVELVGDGVTSSRAWPRSVASTFLPPYHGPDHVAAKRVRGAILVLANTHRAKGCCLSPRDIPGSGRGR